MAVWFVLGGVFVVIEAGDWAVAGVGDVIAAFAGAAGEGGMDLELRKYLAAKTAATTSPIKMTFPRIDLRRVFGLPFGCGLPPAGFGCFLFCFDMQGEFNPNQGRNSTVYWSERTIALEASYSEKALTNGQPAVFWERARPCLRVPNRDRYAIK